MLNRRVCSARNARTDSHLIKKLFEHYCVIAIFSGVYTDYAGGPFTRQLFKFPELRAGTIALCSQCCSSGVKHGYLKNSLIGAAPALAPGMFVSPNNPMIVRNVFS